jgi:hypothetical protein
VGRGVVFDEVEDEVDGGAGGADDDSSGIGLLVMVKVGQVAKMLLMLNTSTKSIE